MLLLTTELAKKVNYFAGTRYNRALGRPGYIRPGITRGGSLAAPPSSKFHWQR